MISKVAHTYECFVRNMLQTDIHDTFFIEALQGCFSYFFLGSLHVW